MMRRLGMGTSPSPFFSQHALRMTFNEKTYKQWKANLPEGTIFPFESSEEFLVTYSDDIEVATD